jgi:hypothetical protein
MLITLRDVLSSYNDGQFANTANLIHMSNPMLADAPVKEANEFYSHTEMQPIDPLNVYESQVSPVEYPISILEGCLIIDDVMYRGINDKAAYLQQEGGGYIKSLARKMGEKLLYTDSNRGNQISLSSIYNDTKKEFIGQQIIDAGGSEEDGLTSIWLISWDFDGIFLVYPKGTPAGYERKVFTLDTVRDSEGNEFYGTKILFRMRLAPVARNPLFAIRIANIPTNENLEDISITQLMGEALGRMDDLKIYGNKSFYANSLVCNKFLGESGNTRVKANDKASTNMFLDIPIKRQNQIKSNEEEID